MYGMCIVFAALALVVGSVAWQRWKYSQFSGPPGGLFFGSLREMFSKGVHIAYRDWLQEYGGIFLVWWAQQPVVVLSDPELIKQVGVKHFSKFHDHPLSIPLPFAGKHQEHINAGMLMARGAYWGSVRAAVQPVFHSTSLAKYIKDMNKGADRLLDVLQEPAKSGDVVDIWRHLGRFTMQVLGETTLGVEFNTQVADGASEPELVKCAQTFFAGSPRDISFLLGFMLPKPIVRLIRTVLPQNSKVKDVGAARTTVVKTAADLLDNARSRYQGNELPPPGPPVDWAWWDTSKSSAYKDVTPAQGSVVDMLCKARNKETGVGLTPRDITAQMVVLIMAGYETTANALAFTVHLLASNPAAQARLLEEVDAFGRNRTPTAEDLGTLGYAGACINEAMRMYPPAALTTRSANAPAQVGKYYFPKGTQVHFNIFGMHHDPQHWVDPETFRPERFINESEISKRHPNAFLPFGIGPRMCVGYKFALQEARIALVRLYQRYTFELASEGPFKTKLNITLGPADGVKVRVIPRGG